MRDNIHSQNPNSANCHHYNISVLDAAAHLFQVSLLIKNSVAKQKLTLPNWLPGSYMIRDFARHLVFIEAKNNEGQVVSIDKVDKSTWQLQNVPGEVLVTYQVYGWDLSVRGAHLDQTHGFFNGSSVFLEVVDQGDLPCLLTVEKPNEPFAANWRVGTSMRVADSSLSQNPAELYGFGDYWSENYDELIDHPFEIANFSLVTFDVLGIQHDLIVYGKHHADLERIANDLSKICETQITMLGALPEDVSRYVFLVAAFGNAYGGLEHRASTALHCSRDELPGLGEDTLSDGYINFLTLCSHEYFHTWNIKKLKPKAFQPFDLTSETYTKQLWIFEGFTSYYEDLMVLMSGVFNSEQYLKLLAQVITRVYRGKGRLKQSVAESSFDAWTRFYKQDSNAPNAIVSYYTKGKLIALCLDLLIRKYSENKWSLFDVYKDLWQSHGVDQKGLEEGELESIILEKYQLPLKEFFQTSVYGTQDLPLKELLAEAGVELTWHSVANYKTLAVAKESQSKDSQSKEPQINLGATIKTNALGAQLQTVYSDGNAHLAGLSTGDIIIALNHIKASSSNIESLLANFRVGDTLAIHAFRRDELLELSITLKAAEKNTACLSVIPGDKQNKLINWIELAEA